MLPFCAEAHRLDRVRISANILNRLHFVALHNLSHWEGAAHQVWKARLMIAALMLKTTHTKKLVRPGLVCLGMTFVVMWPMLLLLVTPAMHPLDPDPKR